MLPAALSHDPLWWAGIGLMGLAVGVIGGMFGVGGNFLLIPLLNVLFKVPLPIAVGTGLCQIIGTGVAALRRHQKLRQGEIKLDWLMLAGGLLGADLGARVFASLAAGGRVLVAGHEVPLIKLVLSCAYVGLLTIVSLWMLLDARRRPANEPILPGPLTRLRVGPVTSLPNSGRVICAIVAAYLGLGLGFLSGLVGMGGGVVLMPVLIYGIGMRVRMAAGTGILVLVASALVGTWAHARLGHVHLGLAMMLLAGSTIGAPLGATITQEMDGRRLRGMFAVLVLMTAAAVAWDLVRVIGSAPVSMVAR